MLSAQILADSINPAGDRITSWLLKYPRYVHSEFMTHRVFGRNAASSRAIPFNKMVAEVLKCPATPEKWGAEQRGMQSGDELTGDALVQCQEAWQRCVEKVAEEAARMHSLGLHKSICNRPLEFAAHMTVLATTTEHPNFYALRAHKDAEPTFQVLAYKMLRAWCNSVPAQLAWGDWHGPWMDRMPEDMPMEDRLKVLTARYARLSYLTFDNEFSIDKDMELYHKLMVADPLHASPSEHVARAEESFWTVIGSKTVRTQFSIEGNDQAQYRGFTPYRKLVPRETTHELDYAAVLANAPEWIQRKLTD